jgi:hypothetical protein
MILDRSIARIGMVALSAAAFVLGITSEADAVSPSNPYRSFNLSGVNYGSMRWEKTHRSGSSPRRSSRRSRYRPSTRGVSATQRPSNGVAAGGVSSGTAAGTPSGVSRSR